jgi:CRISPR/Cas system Type II protein with McrA/HNH and RuvC-like nuclease domain
MAKHTPSIAKNQMLRCLRAIIDPLPTASEIAKLREHFQHKCAYCGYELQPNDRSGQLDHVLAHSEGGTNSIFNHVLSCGPCNGDEKREMPWEDFLALKELSVEIQELRCLSIKGWLSNYVDKRLHSIDVQKEVKAIENAATQSFDTYVQSMRNLRDRHALNT